MIIAAGATGQTSNTTIALIALSGVVVGGALAGGAQLIAERMRSGRERESFRRQARGVARVVRYYLDEWIRLLERSAEARRWWTPEVEPTAEWPQRDLQVVATTLTSSQWETLNEALVAAKTMSLICRGAREDRRSYAQVLVNNERAAKEYTDRIAWLRSGCKTLDDVFG